eukprot:29419_1
MGNKVENDEKVVYHKANMLGNVDMRDIRSVPSMSGLSFQSMDSDRSHHLIHYPSNSALISKSILIRKQRNTQPSTKNEGDKATSIELAQLIIFGYCRSTQIELDYIIPLTIVELCLEFYYISKIVLCLSEGNDIRSGNLNGLSMSDIDNDTNWKLDVYEMTDKDTLILTDNEWKWAFDSCGLCFESNINQCLPNHILHKIQQLYGHNKQQNRYKYNAIFKCGGNKTDGLSSNYANAIIMADGELKAWNWELPRLADYLHGNELIFDHKFGLLCVGGQDDEGYVLNDIYNLKLENEWDEWKWSKLTNLDVGVSKASCCMLHYPGKKHLFIVGGQTSLIGAQNRTQMYDLDANEWHFGQNSMISRFEGGIYYDRYMQKVYFCGGKDKDDSNKITQHHEYYDIQRNVWLDTNIPFINLGTKPLIWTEGDLLYTANFLNYGFSVQFIDIRKDNKQWSVQEHKNSNHKHLSHVPYPQAICRLLI